MTPEAPTAAVDRVLARYPHAPALTRWHMRGRLRLCPYDALPKHLTGAASALVIKSMDAPSGFSGLRAVAEEWIMVSLLRRTMGSGTLLGARSPETYVALGRARGLRCEMERLPTFNPSYILTLRR